MTDPAILFAVFLLVTLVEASSYVRLPLGLLLAIAMLASGSELLPIALVGAAGVTVARLWLALSARRRGPDRRGPGAASMRAQREALGAQLSHSKTFRRTTFVLGALPGVPAAVVFPLLGTMRAPLTPILLGTLVGRTPVLALTTAFFAWVGRWGDGGDGEATVLLGTFALVLLAFRSFGLVDWQHRSETGQWRLKDPDAGAVRLMTSFGSGTGPHAHRDLHDVHGHSAGDGDVLEGELLGEEVESEESTSDSPRPGRELPGPGSESSSDSSS